VAKSNRWFSVLPWFHRKTTGKKIRTLSFFISLLMTPPRYTTTLPCSHAHMPKSCIVIGMWLGHFNLFHGSWYWADERRNTPAVVRISVVPTSATLWRGLDEKLNSGAAGRLQTPSISDHPSKRCPTILRFVPSEDLHGVRRVSYDSVQFQKWQNTLLRRVGLKPLASCSWAAIREEHERRAADMAFRPSQL